MSDTKEYIRRIIVVICIIIIGYTLQVSVFSRLSIAGITPNILVCIVSTYGFMKGQHHGILVGFFVGILVDVFASSYFGLYALVYMYIGFLNGFFKKQFFGDDLRLPLLLIGTSDIIYGLVSYLIFISLKGGSGNLLTYFTDIMIPEAIYTLIVSVFIYYFILKVDQLLDKLDKKGSDKFGNY